MPLPIQRTPRALGQLLATFGGQTPRDLDDNVRGTIELLQFYGRSQQQVRNVTTAAVVAPGFLTLTVPQTEHWVLLHAAFRVTTMAGMTQAQGAISVAGVTAAFTRFAPANVGELLLLPFVPAYPWILLPGTQLSGILTSVTGAANADCAFDALVGVLG